MTDELTALRRMSREAFRQDYRLEVMLAVGRSTDGLVCLSDLAAAVGTSTSNVQGPLRSLIALGLLTPLPRSDSKRRHMLRNPSAAWQWAEELAVLADSQTDSPGTNQLR
ncbi:MarR family transcriptional regulator [Mycobacteroides abscessus]|uniref:Transcriptional regulator n=2 Tax=Mycobacteroides abscessus TaxID=36809 RepID=B1MMA4_MYCA9|nr:MarR family transcriptional regulator [Mycobacteroides abscessus]ALM18940.1 MarR family transcriptional regulator [Mycobacteroides abscessus]AMU48003.1 MarR family transcriptional regulator [Mycobacteroides abscessus]AMU53042.1 MarR family transcriptional regulator [Mycobacteroides abscessus]AMU57998.1 MarR family transcriptional regulator [Mycobacteroides abscessus]ANO11724.1 MarR family transcriptional regulator [Mycobacteroides abscessus]